MALRALRLIAVLEGEIMKKQYAVACSMTTNAGSNYLHTTTLHINEAESLEEAKGLAIDSAMEMKPGFAVAQVVATEIPKPSNAGVTSLPHTKGD